MANIKQYLLTYKFILLSASFGIITTIINYIDVGARGNHISQIPLILRAIDINYLLNDFYVNYASESIARLGFVNFIATLTLLLGSPENLPSLYLSITILSNIAIAVITYLFAYRIFNESSLSGIIASAFVMSVYTFYLGYEGYIYSNTVIPRTIALPLVLLALFFAVVYGRLILSIILCCVAFYFHPLYGLLVGGLLLASYVFSEILNGSIVSKDALKQLIYSILIFTGLFIFSFVTQFSKETLPSEQFIYILATFRAPHHYMPSFFETVDYLFALSFLLASGIAFYYWKIKQDISPLVVARVSFLVAIVFLLCLGGYVFVELIPTRIWTTAQVFRLLIIIKWLGLIFIGGMVADLIQTGEKATAGLYLVSILNPLLIGGASLIQLITDRAVEKYPHSKVVFSIYLMLISLTFIIVLYIYTSPMYYLTLWFFCVLILIFVYYDRKLLSFFATLSIVTILLGVFHSNTPQASSLDTGIDNIVRNINVLDTTYNSFGEESKQIAEFVRNNTSEDSVFLTPVNFGHFRLIAERPIVVDFQSFPFSDAGILEWHNRMINCYGESEQKGFKAIGELNNNYKRIDDQKLVVLQEKYDISYVVLFNETVTSYPVIFQNETFKIVKVI